MRDDKIVECILKIEKKYNFFEKKIYGVYIWKYIRESIVSELRNTVASLAGEMKNIESRNLLDIYYEWLLAGLKNKNDLKKKIQIKNDILFVTQNTRVYEDGCAVDRYVEDYIQNIGNDIIPYVVEWTLRESDTRLPNPKTKNLHYISHEYICSKYNREKLIEYKDIKKMIVSEFIVDLKKERNLTFSDKNIRVVCDEAYIVINYWKAYVRYYMKLFNKVKPKAIFFYNYSEFNAKVLVACARKRNIPIVEISHGYIARDDINYVNDCRNIDIVPDYVLCYGKCQRKFYIRSDCHYGLKKKNIIAIGKIKTEIYRNTDCDRKKCRLKQITVFSSADKKLFDFTLKLSDVLDKSKFKLVYKFHPVEYGRCKKEKNELQKKGITVIDDDSNKLYDVMKNSYFILGTVSTTLYEAIGLGKKVMIFEESSYECNFRSALVKYNVAIGVHSVGDVQDALYDERLTNKLTTKNVEYIMEKNAIANWQTFVRWILRRRTG